MILLLGHGRFYEKDGIILSSCMPNNILENVTNYISVDYEKDVEPDIVYDLRDVPWTFADDNAFEKVIDLTGLGLCNHKYNNTKTVIAYDKYLTEIDRILVAGGVFYGRKGYVYIKNECDMKISHQSDMKKTAQKYYAVKKGRGAPIIYMTWEDCQSAIHGFPRAQYKSFNGLSEARSYLGDTNEKVEIRDTNTTHSPEEKTEKKTLIVFTDGSCSQTGTSRSLAGAGVYFPQLDLEFAMPVPGAQTNNRGELWAVIQALEFVSHLPGPPNLEIHLDSRYVMSNLESNNKENIDLWSYLLELLTKVNTTWVKELAHSGVIGNEKADQLAKRASMSIKKFLDIDK